MALAAVRPEMLTAGLAFGLATGFLMSLAYILSRVYVVRRGGHPIRLLVLSHVVIGIACTALLALIWPVYARFGNSIEPYVLGLPHSLAWVVGWVLATFFVLVAYHATGRDERG